MQERTRERSRTKKRRQLANKQAKTTEDAALREFRRLVIWERWGQMGKACVKQDRTQSLTLAHTLAHVKDKVCSALRFRVGLEERVYRELEFILIGKREAELLKHMRIIRKQGTGIEIWCADSALGLLATRTLIIEARRRVHMCAADAFQLAIPGESQVVLKCKGLDTLYDLKTAVQEEFHIPIADQLLMHLGVEMLDGRLSEHDVFPGSCVQVYTVWKLVFWCKPAPTPT